MRSQEDGRVVFSCLTLVLLCVVSGCASPHRERLPDGPLVEGYGAGVDPQGGLLPGEQRGCIERAELDRVLLAGPQAFIRNLEVSPALLAGKFVGYRIEEIFPGDPRFAGVDLHPGDVILRINRARIERPGQFMKVWESLKVASELCLDYVRGGLVRELCWDIVDERSISPTLLRD